MLQGVTSRHGGRAADPCGLVISVRTKKVRVFREETVSEGVSCRQQEVIRLLRGRRVRIAPTMKAGGWHMEPGRWIEAQGGVERMALSHSSRRVEKALLAWVIRRRGGTGKVDGWMWSQKDLMRSVPGRLDHLAE